MATYKYPIWRDAYENLGTDSAGNGKLFRIKQDGNVVYEGRAYALSTYANIRVRLNDICSQLMGGKYSGTFLVEYKMPNALAWTIGNAYIFRNDWSYNPAAPSDVLFAPIVHRFIPGQLIPIMYTGTGSKMLTAVVSGLSTSFTPTAASVYDNGEDYPTWMDSLVDYLDTNYSSNNVFWVLAFAGLQSLTGIMMGGKKMLLSPTCGRYVLYYFNAYGGFDALPILGGASVEETPQRYLNDVTKDNATFYHAVQNYVSEIAKRWTLHTGMMTADERALLPHLVNSNRIWLHDIGEGRLYPVTMETAGAVLNERRGSLESYTLTVALAQDRIRK